MLTKRLAAKIITASLLTSSVLGVGAAYVPTFAEPVQAAAGMAVTSSTTNQKAVDILNNLYNTAYIGEMPGNVQGLKINESTKTDVRDRYGVPEEPESKDNPFDLYHWTMGQAGYGFSYNNDNTISEIRYFGTGVERQQNLGGITPKVLSKQLGSADKILDVPNTNETDYVYKTGDYELHFVVDDDDTVHHVNLKEAK